MGRASSKLLQYKNAIAVGISFALCTPALADAKLELVDCIAAIVKDSPILYSQIEEKVKTGQTVILSDYPAKPEDSEYEKALQDRVNFELVLQKIDELEIGVDDAEIEAEIDNVLKQRSLTRSGLLDTLRQQGMTYEEYKDDFHDHMIIRKFQGRVIAPLIQNKVTDKQIEAFYLKKSGSTSDNVSLTLRQIFINVPAGGMQSVADGKAARVREVHKKLESGMPFAEAAKLYSDDPSAAESGGLMAPVKLNELSEEIQKTIEPLSAGKFSAPVKLENGYYIFYVDARSFTGGQDFSRQKRNLEYELKAVELQNQTKRWLMDQRRDLTIKFVSTCGLKS